MTSKQASPTRKTALTLLFVLGVILAALGLILGFVRQFDGSSIALLIVGVLVMMGTWAYRSKSR